MRDANVGGTERVLGAARDAKIAKVVYVSTVGIFGNTHGKIVDESYEHPAKGFTSCYEETKWEAHQVAKRLIAEGLPCVIVQPGGVYGPGDTSSIGELLTSSSRARCRCCPSRSSASASPTSRTSPPASCSASTRASRARPTSSAARRRPSARRSRSSPR